MAYFSNTIAAWFDLRTVYCTLLADFDFASGAKHIFRGYGNLPIGGTVYQGLGDVGDISGLDQAINGVAPECTIVLSGVDSQVSTAANNSFHEARGRAFVVSLQFFDQTGALLDSPAPINELVMERIEINSSGPSKRDVIVHAENIFTARGFPIHGWLSDRDQQSRYAGDRGLERIPILQYHIVTWPRA